MAILVLFVLLYALFFSVINRAISAVEITVARGILPAARRSASAALLSSIRVWVVRMGFTSFLVNIFQYIYFFPILTPFPAHYSPLRSLQLLAVFWCYAGHWCR